MNPSEIKRLILQAKTLSDSSQTAPEAFLLAFVAWEGFKMRLLVAALCANGYSVVEAKALMRSREIWKTGAFETLFAELYGTRPKNSRFVGTKFNSLSRAITMRNSYVHGFSRYSPRSFLVETERLIGLVESDWTSSLNKLRKANGMTGSIGNPLGTLKRTK